MIHPQIRPISVTQNAISIQTECAYALMVT